MSNQRPQTDQQRLCKREGKAIELQDINLHYANQTALKNISLSIDSGERIAVVGPNGAGKSSLLHILSGVIAPSSGTVQVHGHSPARYFCTAYVPQSRQLDWNFPLTTADVVMMGRTGLLGLFRRPGEKDWLIVNDALERMAISDLATHQISQLSGGQRQRMFIARALAQEADLLLMDEPLAGLDLPSKEHIFTLLDHLKDEGVTILMATHDLNLAADRFDRVLLLSKEILGFGNAKEVFSKDILNKAYDGHVHVVETSDGRRILGDMGGHHDHHSEGSHA